MAAITRDLDIEQGATYRREYTVTTTEGSPIDFTGASARMMIRAKPGSALLAAADTAGGGIVITGDTIALTLSAAQTDALPPTTSRPHRWDMEIEFPSGDVLRLLQGAVTVSAAITRPEAGDR